MSTYRFSGAAVIDNIVRTSDNAVIDNTVKTSDNTDLAARNADPATDIQSSQVFSKADADIEPSQPQLTKKETPSVTVNGRLADSRLKMVAIKAFPQQVEIEITQKEAVKGTSRNLEIDDNTCCISCVNLKPVNRLGCQTCKGLGYVLNKRLAEINLSAGLSPGQMVVCKGAGRYDFRSRQNSDLVIKIKISEKAA